MKIKEELFGHTANRKDVIRYTIPSAAGMELQIINFGGIITSLKVPSRNGTPVDVVLGFDRLDGYLARHPFFGAMVGRYANRIGGAAFTLDEKNYSLAANNNGNHLHGGITGFDRVIWEAEPFTSADRRGVALSYTSPDGEEGYPGTLQVSIRCGLTDRGELFMEYRAATDAPTPVNLTNHSYFNFTGGSHTILDHEILIDADAITEINEQLIPTGNLMPVEGTPFDFREKRKIGSRIKEVPGGYDHNYCLKNKRGEKTRAAVVTEETSGIRMEVITTKPGMQFYTGNFLDGSLTGKGGRPCIRHSGFCLETQYYPDSPNHENFPSSILKQGEEYRHETVYRFSTFS